MGTNAAQLLRVCVHLPALIELKLQYCHHDATCGQEAPTHVHQSGKHGATNDTSWAPGLCFASLGLGFAHDEEKTASGLNIVDLIVCVLLQAHATQEI